MVASHHIMKALANERVADLHRDAPKGHGPRIKPRWLRRPQRATKRRQRLSVSPSEE